MGGSKTNPTLGRWWRESKRAKPGPPKNLRFFGVKNPFGRVGMGRKRTVKGGGVKKGFSPLPLRAAGGIRYKMGWGK
jgi:hypothetical protein